MFLPLTIVLTRHLRGFPCARATGSVRRRVGRRSGFEYTSGGPRDLAGQRSRATVRPRRRSRRRRRAPPRRPRASRRSSRRRRRGGPSGRRRRGGRRIRVRAADPVPRSRNAPATLAARWSRSRSNWAIVARPRSRARAHGRPRRSRGDRRDQLRLVVAALALALGVDRDRDEEVAAGPDPRPAPRDRVAERHREASLARVLELVERMPDRAGERRAPLELEQGRRHVGRQPERGAGGQVEARVEGRQAASRRAAAPSRPQPAQTRGKARSRAAEVRRLSERMPG